MTGQADRNVVVPGGGATGRFAAHYADSWAAVIGIDNYKNHPGLKCAAADAVGMAEVLIGTLGVPPSHVHLIVDTPATLPARLAVWLAANEASLGSFSTEASKTAIEGLLMTTVISKRNVNDRVLVYFAGHGATQLTSDDTGGREWPYLVPSDARRDEFHTYVDLFQVVRAEQFCNAKHLLYLLDACSAGLTGVRAVEPSRYETDLLSHRARQCVTSGTSAQYVADRGYGDHSLFTWNLLQVLKDVDAPHGDGPLTASKLAALLRERVGIDPTSRQTPDGFALVGHQGGDFVFRPGGERRLQQQRDAAHRLLAASWLERGRRLVLDGHAMRGLPYLHRARSLIERAGETIDVPFHMLLAEAARAVPAARLASMARIERAVLSHDGRRVITAASDHTAMIWDRATGQPSGHPLVHTDTVHDVGFDPTGERVITACADGSARIWHAATGEPIGGGLAHDGPVHLARYSPSGRLILTASWDRTARVWGADGAARTPLLPLGDKIVAAWFSPDERAVVVAGPGAAARFACDDGRPLGPPLRATGSRRLIAMSPDGADAVVAEGATAVVHRIGGDAPSAELAHDAYVTGAAFSPDGGQVITVGDDAIRRYDLATGRALPAILARGAAWRYASFDPGGTCIVARAADRTVRLLDRGSGLPVGPPLETAREVIHHDLDAAASRHLVVTTLDGVATIWDLDRARDGARTSAHARGWLEAVAFAPDGDRLVTAGSDHAVRVWTPGAAALVLEHRAAVESVVIAPAGDRAVTVAGAIATVWDLASGRPLHELPHAQPISSVALAADGRRAITAGRDHVAKLWDLDAPRAADPLIAVLGHPRAVTSAAFSPDGAVIVTTCADGNARLWRDATAALLPHATTVLHAAFDRTGGRVVTASRDRTARVWDVDTAAPRTDPIVHLDQVKHAAFSPDGARVLTVSGNAARVWDATRGWAVTDPIEHHDLVLAARYSPDGQFVATAGKDGLVQIVDAATGQPVIRPLAHPARVNDLAWRPDGRAVATASGDRFARVWELARDDRAFAEWTAALERCPYALAEDTLVEQRFLVSRVTQ
jgi:WD40 repeat protein